MAIKEKPILIEDPKTLVYIPGATTQTKGIASFNAKDFLVDSNNKVSLKENLGVIKEDSSAAKANSLEALSKAEEALGKSEEALSISEEALGKAEEALETANGIDGKATEALSKSEEALAQVTEGAGTKIYENGVLQSSVNVDSDIQEQLNELGSSVSTVTMEMEDVQEAIDSIQEVIPNRASAQNQLADKNFVNSSINAIAAFYITADEDGEAFATKSALNSATSFYSGGETRVPTRNDYCLVLEDEEHDNASCRYVYTGVYPNGQWDFQFVVNETPFTSSQVAAINSGITANLLSSINQNLNELTTELTPIGSVVAYAGSIPPNGWLICNGSTFNQTNYPLLYNVLQKNTLPDLRDRFIVGAGLNYALGATGGSKDAVVVSHSHHIHDNMTGNRVGVGTGNSGYDRIENVTYNTSIGQEFVTETEGVSGTDKNMPPYFALVYIIRAK